MSQSESLDLNLLTRQARRAQNNGAMPQAYALYVQVNEADPQNALGWIGRSETAEDEDERLISLGYAVALDPKNHVLADRLRTNLDERLKHAGRSDTLRLFEVGREFALVGLAQLAGHVFQRVTEVDPTHVEAWLWRAGMAGDHREAETAVGIAQALAPDNATVQAAQEWLDNATYIAPLPPMIDFDEEMDLEPAPKAESKPVAPSPVVETTRPIVIQPAPAAKMDPRAMELEQALMQAEQFLRADDKRAAYAQFVHATEIDPRSERAWLGRARASDNTDEALAALDNALTLNPENSQVRETRNFLRRRKLRESQPPPESLPAQHPLRESVHMPVAAPPRARSRLPFILLATILALAIIAILAWWYLVGF